MGFGVSPVKQEDEWIRVPRELVIEWFPWVSWPLTEVSGCSQQSDLGFSLEDVCWRSHGRLESTWLQLSPQIGVLEEAERKTKCCVFVPAEFKSCFVKGKGGPVKGSKDLGWQIPNADALLCWAHSPCRMAGNCYCGRTSIYLPFLLGLTFL